MQDQALIEYISQLTQVRSQLEFTVIQLQKQIKALQDAADKERADKATSPELP